MKRAESAQMPLRLPVTLHRALKRAAEQEGVSLNQYCLFLLASRVPDTMLKTDERRQRGEELLRFLTEAHALQQAMRGPSRQGQEVKPKETPSQRWKHLYGKNRSPFA